jgi:hypothetical protein
LAADPLRAGPTKSRAAWLDHHAKALRIASHDDIARA